jgi:hypothetical protein
MKKYELMQKLIDEGYPENIYELDGGFPNDAFTLNKTKSGWEVYFSERGSKYELKRFKTEDEACDYLYSFLSNDKGIQKILYYHKHPEKVKISNITKLSRKLIEANIPPKYYSINIGSSRGIYEMVKNDTQWEIYVNNNGIKKNVRYFDDEVEACDYFFDLVYTNVKEDEKKSK